MSSAYLRQLILLIALLAVQAPSMAAGFPRDLAGWWLTPDQRGQLLMAQQRYREAAETFEDPWQKGAAFYRAGDFESAAAVFGRMRSAEAAYNRGNALIMLGRYEEAIASLQEALRLRAGWPEASQNLAIARARLEMLAPPDDDAGGTGGKLGADEIVFDESGRVSRSGQEETTSGAEALSEDEMRAVWLRRVRSEPADFLRARFAHQLYRQEQEALE
jgi:Ca-activated chloride channel family protein